MGNRPQSEQDRNKPSIPEDDVTTFCLWLKENHKAHVGKVTISKRLTDVPLVLFGQVSAQMRIMAQMMQQQSENPAEAARQIEQMSSN